MGRGREVGNLGSFGNIPGTLFTELRVCLEKQKGLWRS